MPIEIEPTPDMIQRRWHKIVEGVAVPYIPRLEPPIAFLKITRLHRKIADDLYQERLADLRKESAEAQADGKPGLIDELDIPRLTREWAKEREPNVDLTALFKAQWDYLQNLIGKCPIELVRTSVQQFSDDEIAAMDTTTRIRYEVEELVRIKKQNAWVAENTTPDQQEILDFVSLLRAKQNEWSAHAMQPMARAYRSVALMVMCSFDPNSGDMWIPVFKVFKRPVNDQIYRAAVHQGVVQWDALDIPDTVASTILRKWREWEEGRTKDFMLR